MDNDRSSTPVNTEAPNSREEEILRAADQVFCEKGFHGATMLDVARRARASKATLYGRFGSKESLLHALLAWGTRQQMAELERLTLEAAGDPETALLDFARQLLALITAPGAIALQRIAIAEGGRQPEVGQILNSLTRDRVAEMMHRIAENLAVAGKIRIDTPADFGPCFIGMLRGDLYYQLLLGVTAPPSAEEINRRARMVVDRLLRAFAP